MANDQNSGDAPIPERSTLRYEQLLEEIRSHNSQLLTMDSVFVPIFFAILGAGITDAQGKTECLSILTIAAIVVLVFIHISCRGLTMIESLKTQVIELEKQLGISVLRTATRATHLDGYDHIQGWKRKALNMMFSWGRIGPPVVLFLIGAMLLGLIFYGVVCWWKCFK
jgi:hypothetical protein